jgi:hypothetical protein
VAQKWHGYARSALAGISGTFLFDGLLAGCQRNSAFTQTLLRGQLIHVAPACIGQPKAQGAPLPIG